MTQRTFIAIDISGAQRAAIGHTIGTLKPLRADVKWVRPENLHLTVKFLGDLDEGAVDKIALTLKELTAGYAPFQIELRTIGAFSSLKRPDIIWTGVTKSPELDSLAADIEEGLSLIGIKKEGRPFSPHLTIARVKSLRDYTPLYEKLCAISDKDFGVCDVREIALMRSELTPGGAQYTRLKSFPLDQTVS
ncbi:RNA 2',3'-cyclic phosphodiesterase [Candidatus Magnetominusculus dajiuhuensis]|uniref:RNA 2',3'-cyclic phosphodiesterase n=1 Tax=Candidatus Magnetominusculus dajiuhuensis TaxID=3137712 RepID=UPI003B42A05D